MKILTKQVMIRADGGPNIGYGHIVRTGVIASEVLSRGHKVIFATTTPKAVEEVCPRDISIVTLEDRANPSQLVEQIESVTPDAVMTDAYPVDTGYQRRVQKHAPLIVHQDDTRHAVCADIFLNWNIYGPELDYEFVGQHPETHLGTEYVPLRSAIRDQARRIPRWRQAPGRAIITMGGSDVADLTPTTVSAFDGTDIRIDVIIGPGFSEQKEENVRSVAENISAEVDVVRNPTNLPERLFMADFAVTAAGSTVYELLAIGTPLVCVPVVENQELIAQALNDHNAATVLEREDYKSSVCQAIETQMADTELRRKRQQRGRELVDVRGAERVTDVLLGAVERG